VPKTLAKQPFVRELYIQHAINQQDVVQKAANINITKGLDANKAGYLPVHCICAMLHWRKFSKYSTPIQVRSNTILWTKNNENSGMGKSPNDRMQSASSPHGRPSIREFYK
jgi:hypothetical protein